MTNEQDTDHEQWEAVGAQTEQAQDQLNELFTELAENVHEDVWREQFNQINFGLSDLKLTLEGRMETERPDSDVSDVFYDSEPALSNEEEENDIRELAHEHLGENVQVVQSTPRSLKIMFSGASTSKIDQFRVDLHQRGYATARPVNRLITITQGSLETLSSDSRNKDTSSSSD